MLEYIQSYPYIIVGIISLIISISVYYIDHQNIEDNNKINLSYTKYMYIFLLCIIVFGTILYIYNNQNMIPTVNKIGSGLLDDSIKEELRKVSVSNNDPSVISSLPDF